MHPHRSMRGMYWSIRPASSPWNPNYNLKSEWVSCTMYQVQQYARVKPADSSETSAVLLLNRNGCYIAYSMPVPNYSISVNLLLLLNRELLNRDPRCSTIYKVRFSGISHEDTYLPHAFDTFRTGCTFVGTILIGIYVTIIVFFCSSKRVKTSSKGP